MRVGGVVEAAGGGVGGGVGGVLAAEGVGRAGVVGGVRRHVRLVRVRRLVGGVRRGVGLVGGVRRGVGVVGGVRHVRRVRLPRGERLLQRRR